MAAHTWQLDRDIHLARYRGDSKEVERLERTLAFEQTCCTHVPNPDRPERCYKCGKGLGPGLKKAEPCESTMTKSA